MNMLKSNRHIFSAFLLIFGVNIVLATNGQELKRGSDQEQQQEGRKSDQTMIHPDGDYATAGQQQEYQNEEIKQEPQEVTSISQEPQRSEEKSDSLRDDSVSKYNFIFYFLYKFKYDTEETP